jgi:hypothetical protein
MRYYFTDYQAGQAMRYYFADYQAGQTIRYYFADYHAGQRITLQSITFAIYQAGHITLQTIKLGKNEINNKTLLCRLSSWTMRYYFADCQAGQTTRCYFAVYEAGQTIIYHFADCQA